MAEHEGVHRFTKRVWLAVAIVAVVVIVLSALTYLLTGFLILFAGVLLGVFFSQLSRLISEGTALPYKASVGLVVVTLLAIAGATFYFMGSAIGQRIGEFSEQFQQAGEQLQTRLQDHDWLRWLRREVTQNEGQLQPTNVIATAGSAVVSTLSAVGGAILVLFLGFYFALQSELYHAGLVRLFPRAHRPRVAEVSLKVTRSLWWWCLGRLVAMLLIGAGSAVGLWLLGIPLPVTLGVIAGLLNFVPNLGPIVASVPPMLFALQQGTDTVLWVAGFFLLLQFVESYFITPLIDQQQINLPPGLVLSTQLLFGMVAGVLGLLVSTPLTAAIYILVREVYVKDILESDPH